MQIRYSTKRCLVSEVCILVVLQMIKAIAEEYRELVAASRTLERPCFAK